jgi:aryl-alcohol dehydrogenase-like predicted oxidoreductase
MLKRTLGQSGLAIAPLAFGGNVFGSTADEATSFQLLEAFVAAAPTSARPACDSGNAH